MLPQEIKKEKPWIRQVGEVCKIRRNTTNKTAQSLQKTVLLKRLEI